MSDAEPWRDAGPETDALVAEKVMGWRRLTWAEFKGGRETRNTLTPYWHGEDGKGALAEFSDDYYNPEPAWSPSTDISDAWDVVERAAEGGIQPGVELMQDGRWLCDWTKGFEQAAYVWADTAPLAICLAALKAVED